MINNNINAANDSNKLSSSMSNQLSDWKDIANSYYDKSLSLAVLFLLFAFLVSPRIEVKPYVAQVRVTEAIDIPPEIREQILPPQEIIRPAFEPILDDDLTGDDDEIRIEETIAPTTLDFYERVPPPSRHGETPRFVVYEEEPQPIRTVTPDYPSFARRAGLQGQVLLEVEVLKDGSVGAINVLRSLSAGPGGLDQAAVDAVRQWEFTPAKSSGQPVAVWARIPIEFSLD